MVFNRDAALDYLRGCTLCNGLVIEFHDRMQDGVPWQRIFLFNQCALTAEAFRRAGDSRWMAIRDALRAYFESNGFYGASNIRNYFYPIINQQVVPHGPSFLATIDFFYFQNGPGTDLNPREVITNTEPVDPLTSVCGDLPSNRAMTRALYHWQQGQTSTANTCYDATLAANRPEGFAIADSFDFETTGPYAGFYRYSTYKMMIHWIVAFYMGRTRLLTNYLDQMQDPTDGKVMQFCKNNFVQKGGGNTETTALAVIADLLWNPGGGTPPAPPPPPSVPDWTDPWERGSNRTYTADGVFDAQDSRVEYRGGDSRRFEITVSTGIVRVTGDAARIFVRGSPTWRNTEQQLEVFYPTGGTGVDAASMRTRSNHRADCGFGGYTLTFEPHNNEVYMKKEGVHPIYTHRVQTNPATWNQNAWNTIKHKVYNVENNTKVRCEAYLNNVKIMDLTDNGSGGWADWDTDPEDESILDDCNVTLTQLSKPHTNAEPHNYLRFDNASNVQIRNYTMRELVAGTDIALEPVAPPIPSPPPPDAGVDQFNVRKIYQDKTTGTKSNPFYLSTAAQNDCRFSTNTVITKNADGSYRMAATGGRLQIFTSGTSGCAKDVIWEAAEDLNMEEADHSGFADKGYMYNDQDWLNFEFTGYFKIPNAGSADKSISMYGRGWRHNENMSCLGTSYRVNVKGDGAVEIVKKSYHHDFGSSSSCSDHITETLTNLGYRTDTGQWFGVKLIVWNFRETQTNRLSVHIEIWIDKNGSNYWVKAGSRDDTGGWATDYSNNECPAGTYCGSSDRDRIITWGGPIAYVGWNDYETVDFRSLSCREILPPSSAIST